LPETAGAQSGSDIGAISLHLFAEHVLFKYPGLLLYGDLKSGEFSSAYVYLLKNRFIDLI
jgi:hypothetical protein